MPAGTGVWVVNTTCSRTRCQASSSTRPRAAARCASSSNTASAGWPSFRCTTDGSMPSARSARTPPTPSTRVLRQADRAVALVEARGDPAADRAVLRRGRCRAGTAARGRRRRARPAPTTSSSSTGTRTVSGCPSAPVTRTQGRRSGSVSSQYSCWQPGDVDALVEVAGAVHQADADHRQRQVGGLLQDVAGQHARARPSRSAASRARRTRRSRRPPGARAGPAGAAGPGPIGRSMLARPGARPGRRGRSAAAPRAASTGGLGQQAPRVGARTRPALGIDGREHGGAIGRPRPAVVVGHPRQRLQRLGQACGHSATAASISRSPANMRDEPSTMASAAPDGNGLDAGSLLVRPSVREACSVPPSGRFWTLDPGAPIT